jgi:8-oxo-dGTP pyrophosphatase MutT (NUDIX family)
MIDPWQHLSTEPRHDYRIFSTRTDLCRSPRSSTDHEFVVVEAPDWVNVIALTPENEVVLVRQYRFGTREVTLEIPGGAVDAGEDFVQAGLRELREETGYEGDDVRLLGTVSPNPAFIQNACGTILVTHARQVDEPRPEGTEILEVELRPLAEIPRLIADRKIHHALVVAAFYWLDLAERKDV